MIDLVLIPKLDKINYKMDNKIKPIISKPSELSCINLLCNVQSQIKDNHEIKSQRFNLKKNNSPPKRSHQNSHSPYKTRIINHKRVLNSYHQALTPILKRETPDFNSSKEVDYTPSISNKKSGREKSVHDFNFTDNVNHLIKEINSQTQSKFFLQDFHHTRAVSKDSFEKIKKVEVNFSKTRNHFNVIKYLSEHGRRTQTHGNSERKKNPLSEIFPHISDKNLPSRNDLILSQKVDFASTFYHQKDPVSLPQYRDPFNCLRKKLYMKNSLLTARLWSLPKNGKRFMSKENTNDDTLKSHRVDDIIKGKKEKISPIILRRTSNIKRRSVQTGNELPLKSPMNVHHQTQNEFIQIKTDYSIPKIMQKNPPSQAKVVKEVKEETIPEKKGILIHIPVSVVNADIFYKTNGPRKNSEEFMFSHKLSEI